MTGIERVPTGVPGLDTILMGGFPLKSSTILYGPPGSGKASLCIQFIKKGLETGDVGLYVTTKDIENIRAKMEQLGLDHARYEKEGRLIIVNPLSGEMSGLTVPRHEELLVVETAQNIRVIANTINMARHQVGEGEIRFVVDSLTGLYLKTLPEHKTDLQRLIENIVRRVRQQGHVALFTLDTSTDESDVKTLRFLTDGFIELVVNLYDAAPERRMVLHNLVFTGRSIGRYDYRFIDKGLWIPPG